MTYLYWYLGTGGIVLIAVFSAHRLAKKDDWEGLRLPDAKNPERDKLSSRLVNNVVAPAVAAVCIVLLWPVAAYMEIKDFASKRLSGSKGGREFAVERGHLQERLTLQEVEAREIVDDPLGAVPKLPFGHLNAAWHRFLAGRLNGDELWSFTAMWQGAWGPKELRVGYVLVQDGTPGAHFLTMVKELPKEAESDDDANALRLADKS